eukprot:767206-Hanusia_phi.AAC.3
MKPGDSSMYHIRSEWLTFCCPAGHSVYNIIILRHAKRSWHLVDQMLVQLSMPHIQFLYHRCVLPIAYGCSDSTTPQTSEYTDNAMRLYHLSLSST